MIILVIQGSTGTPNRHLEVQVSIFVDFRFHFGSPRGPTLETFSGFVVDLEWQSGRQFPGPFFWWSRGGNTACMRWLYVLEPYKKLMFLNGCTFSTYSLIWCPAGGIWLTFWSLLVTLGSLFLIFWGPGDRLEFWWFLRGALEGPRLRQYTPVRVEMLLRGPSKQLKADQQSAKS